MGGMGTPADAGDGPAGRGNTPGLPEPTGRFPVGTTSLWLTDTTRPDPWAAGVAARELMVSLWYPATPSDGRRARYMTPAESELHLTSRGITGVPPGLLSTVRANAVSDAPPTGRQRALPLVVLSPGFTNSRSVLTALAEDLASHGYAVAGIDHTYESFGTAFPDGRVTTCLARETRRRSDGFWEKLMAGRAADVSFVLNELTGAHPAWPGAGLIDPSRIAMAGHSIGGAAAIAALLADSRIRAGIDMDGTTHTPIPDHGLSRPFLFLGKQSNYTPGSGRGHPQASQGAVTTWEHDWRLLTGWKRWLVVSGAIHASFTDLGLLADQAGIDVGAGLPGARSLDITRAYVRAFFDQHLRGRPQALLDRPSARYPEVTFCSPEAESWTERSDPDPARLGWLVRESGVASDEASRRFGGASMSERGNKKSQEPHLGRELNGARDRAASWMRKRPKQPVNPSRATMGGGETSQATPPPLSVLLAAMGKSGATGLNQPGTAGPNFSASHQIAANFTQPGAAALTPPGAAGLSTSQRIAAALNPPRAAGLHRPGDSAASSGPAPAVYMWGMTTSNPNDATLSGASGLVGADSNRGAELSPADPRVIADRGETHLLMGRYEQALADISRAAQVRPADPRIIADRGQTHLLMGHYEQALADISRAAKLDPDNPWLIAARGETYRLMGRYKKALADFSRAIKLDPDNAWAITGRGITYRQMGRYEQAVEDFSLAFGLDPDPLLIADRGETYRLMGRHAEAMADLDRARAEPTKLDQLIEQALTELSGAGAAEDRSQPRVTASEHGRASAGTTDSLPQQAVSPARPRYLKGQCPESIPVGEPFSLLVSIVLAGPASDRSSSHSTCHRRAGMCSLSCTPRGCELLGRQRHDRARASRRGFRAAMFELRADAPGARRVSVTAWLGGSYLGELLVEITAERDRPPGPHRDVLAEIDTEPTEGAVSLVVRYDPGQKAYRFEFRDEDNPDEVTSHLAYEPGPQVERLVAELGRAGQGTQ